MRGSWVLCSRKCITASRMIASNRTTGGNGRRNFTCHLSLLLQRIGISTSAHLPADCGQDHETFGTRSTLPLGVQRQHDSGRGALALATFDLDLAAVLCDDASGYEKTPVRRCNAAARYSERRVEKPREVRGRNTVTVVAYFENNFPVPSVARDSDRAFLFNGCRRVPQQIREYGPRSLASRARRCRSRAR